MRLEESWGQLVMKYNTVKLGEYLYIKGRIGWKGLKKNEYLHASDYRIINGESLTNGGIDWEKAGYITEERYVESPEIMLKPNDILISKDGTIGKIGYVKSLEKPTTVASGIFVVRNIRPSEINTRFIYHFLTSRYFKDFIIMRTEGSVIPHLYQKDFVELDFPLPDMNIQDRVVGILDSLEMKIEFNKKINDNLEQQAQAIFSTFISDHQTTTVTVEDIVLTANTGADAIQKAPIVDYDTGVRCVRVGDMSNQRPVHEWGFAQVTPEIFKQYQLHKDDIVVTRTASLGLNRLIGEDLSAVYNNGLIRISINQDIVYPLIVYRQFQTDDYRNYISRISGETSVRPNMKINYLLKYSFEIPCLSDQAELISILKPIFETQERNISENQTLSSLRDTLLPKLMSGELDVSKIDL